MTTAIAQLPCLISHPLEGPKNLEITDPFPHQSLCVFGLFLTHWKARIRSMILQIKLTANWVLLLQIKAEQANQERRVRLQVGAHRQLRDVAEHDEGLVRAQGKGVHRHEHEHFPDSCWTLWKRGMYYEQLKPSFCCLSWFFVVLLFLDKASTGRSQQSTAITAVYVLKAKAIYYTAKSTFVRAFWLISQRLGTTETRFKTTTTFERSENGSLRFSHTAPSGGQRTVGDDRDQVDHGHIRAVGQERLAALFAQGSQQNDRVRHKKEYLALRARAWKTLIMSTEVGHWVGEVHGVLERSAWSFLDPKVLKRQRSR